MISDGDNSCLVHQSSLAVLPAAISGASRRNGRRNENFAYQYLKYVKGSSTCRKILRHGTSGFSSHPKEGVLRIFIVLNNPSLRPCLNLRPLSPVANTLTTIPPKQLEYLIVYSFTFRDCVPPKIKSNKACKLTLHSVY
jgi:hypothetical protein